MVVFNRCGIRMFVISTLVVCLARAGWCKVHVNDPTGRYSETLKAVVRQAYQYPNIKVDVPVPPWLWDPNHSQEIRIKASRGLMPMGTLDEPDCVPFLIDIMLNGPDWEDEEQLKPLGGILPHIARCVAARKLGVHKDKRAFEPLVRMLKYGTFLEDKYKITYIEKEKVDIRIWAAEGLGSLGDLRAVEPLIEMLSVPQPYVKNGIIEALGKLKDTRATMPLVAVLKNEPNTMRLCFEALRNIRDMRAIPFMIEAAERNKKLEYLLYMPLCDMTGIYFNKIRSSSRERYFTVAQFPELGEINSHVALWKHWMKVGDEWTKKGFEEGYPRFKNLKKTHPKNEPIGFSSRVTRYGVATMPLVIEKLKQGDTDGIEIIVRLSGFELKSDATAKECLEWWEKNKNRLTIPFEDPNQIEGNKGADRLSTDLPHPSPTPNSP